VERREKILEYVARGEKFENVGVEPRGPSERAQKNFEMLFFEKSMWEYVRGCRREDWYSRWRDDDDRAVDWTDSITDRDGIDSITGTDCIII